MTAPKTQQAEARVEQLEIALNALYASRSWRITAPLRWVGQQMRLLRQHGLMARLKAFFKKISGANVNANSNIKIEANTGTDTNLNSSYVIDSEIYHLTPRARQIYFDLKLAIEQRQKRSN